MRVLMAIVGLAACGGRDPEGASLGGNIVGEWRAIWESADPPTPEDDRFALTFNADGTLRSRPSPGVFNDGTYSVEGGFLTLDLGNGPAVMPYSVDGDWLLLNALEPDVIPDGVIGSWSGTQRPDGSEPMSLEIRPDRTATVMDYHPALPGDFEATWTAVGWEVELNIPDVPPLQVRVVDSLVGSPYERIP